MTIDLWTVWLGKCAQIGPSMISLSSCTTIDFRHWTDQENVLKLSQVCSTRQSSSVPWGFGSIMVCYNTLNNWSKKVIVWIVKETSKWWYPWVNLSCLTSGCSQMVIEQNQVWPSMTQLLFWSGQPKMYIFCLSWSVGWKSQNSVSNEDIVGWSKPLIYKTLLQGGFNIPAWTTYRIHQIRRYYGYWQLDRVVQ